MDLFLYDLKIVGPERHEEMTGRPNGPILQNLRWLAKRCPGKVTVRVPVVPLYTDFPGNLEGIAALVSDLGLPPPGVGTFPCVGRGQAPRLRPPPLRPRQPRPSGPREPAHPGPGVFAHPIWPAPSQAIDRRKGGSRRTGAAEPVMGGKTFAAGRCGHQRDDAPLLRLQQRAQDSPRLRRRGFLSSRPSRAVRRTRSGNVWTKV